jgi:polysaccharide biosynthesis transport protein
LRYPKNLPLLTAARIEQPVQVSIPTQEPPADDAQSGLSLAQLWCIAWAFRVQTAIIAVSIIAATAAVIKLMPKTYAGTATLMVNYASNDPLIAGIATGPVGTYISTEIELMQSAGVILPVVDKLNLTSDKNYTDGYRPGVGDLRQWAAEVVAKDLDIEQGRFGSQLIYITASARDPLLAANIANAVATIYLEQQKQRVYAPATERAKNYANELGELKYKVGVAQDQVTAFRQKTGAPDAAAPNNANVEADLLASLEQKYQDAQNLRRAAEVAVSTESGPASTTVMGSTLVQTLRQQLDDQNRQIAQLRATMGPAHPKVIELQNQIEATHRSLNSEIGTYSSNVTAQLAAARELEKKLAAAIEVQRAKALGVRKLQDEGTKYSLELESAQSVYKRALDGYDQIMFASGEHYTNINFVSRAAPVMKALKPNKPKLMLVGVLGGLLMGLAAPFAYELVLNRRVRCRDDFERGFGVHVLTEFDAIKFTPSSA